MSSRARIAVLLVVAAVARFAWIATPLATFDETWSWYLVELIHRAGAFWKPVGVGLDAPLFVAIDLGMTRLFGHDSVVPLRLPPAVFATASVPIFYAIVRRLGSERLAWRAALLMAVSPFFVYYGKDARPYAQLLCSCLLFTWAFLASEGSPKRWRRRLGLGVLTALAIGSHYYALSYFAAFYGQRLWLHWRAGRRAAARDDFVTGAIGALVASPLLLVFALSVSRVSLPYWRSPTLNAVSVIAEQFLFTGAAGAGNDPNAAVLMLLQLTVFLLLFVPVWVRRRRHAPPPDLHPMLAHLWWFAPVMVQVHDLLSSRSAMFFPRGFIASAPFLLTWWLAQCDAMPVGRRWRRAYMGLMLTPVVAFGYQTMVCDPTHAAFKNRDVVTEVADQMHALDGRFDVAVVHLWWATQYVAYYYRGPARVEPLGMWNRPLAVHQGEMAAVLEAARTLPPTDRVLLVENAMATDYVDPDGLVRDVLDATRPRLATAPCHPTLEHEVGIVCRHLILYGPVGGVAAPDGAR